MTTTPDTTEDFAHKLATQFVPSTNIDGWTGPRQKRFLEAIADGDTVRDACGHVFLSPQSAYAFRRRPKGRAFDLGWKAADLLAREKVAADLLGRAVDGQEITITRADGSTATKHHYDNRLALTMLARLDRYADAAAAGPTDAGHAARLVASDFDAYLDLVGSEGGPARAGLFMLARGGDPASALDPIVALARADVQLRCGTLATDIDVTDLDPAARAGWTAEQWARAEAAGVVVLAPPPAPQQPASECQRVSTPHYIAPENRPEPVWWDEDSNDGAGAWNTRFPPPEDFGGQEDGEYGDPGYSRTLDEEELELLEAEHHAQVAVRRAIEAPERDRWFAACAPQADTPTPDAPNGAAADDGDAAALFEDEADPQEEDEEEQDARVLAMIARGDAMLRARSPQGSGTPERPAAPPVERTPSSDDGDSHGLQEA